MDKIFKISLSVFSGLGILKIFSIIPFNRMAGDDYSSAIMGRLGLWGSLVETYKTSMGRFTAVLIETPFSTGLAYSGNVSVYSIITFMILFAAILVLIKSAFNISYKNLLLYLLSGAVFVAFYQLTPNKSESWYWLTGSVVYLWPIILFILAASFLFKDKPKKTDYILSFLCIFFAAGGNEAFSLMIITSLCLIVFLDITGIWKYKFKKMVIIMLLAAVAAFTVMYLAPGNAERKASYGSNPMSIPGSVLYSFSEGPKLYMNMLTSDIYLLLPLILVLVCVLAYIHPIKHVEKTEEIYKKIFITVIAGLFLSAVFMLPAFVGLGRIQPDRSNISLSFVIIVQILMIAYITSLLLKNQKDSVWYKSVAFISASSMVFVATVFTHSLPQDMFIAKNYSQHLDAMIARFQQVAKSANPNEEIKVALPEHGLVAELIDPPGVYSYKNLSLSQYFGIGKVITVEYKD